MRGSAWKTAAGLSLIAVLLAGRLGIGGIPKPLQDSTTRVISESDCTSARLGTTIPVASIGEPVSSVILRDPRWILATAVTPSYCSVDGVLSPVDAANSAKPINFRVILPSSWSHRAAQIGGSGFNGMIPNLTGSGDGPLLARGIATYGSDSGHQSAGPTDWTLNDEAIKNLGYMQMKKTHDAAMVLMERAYGARPALNYYIGTSQGGREALTVAQRYPADYNGIAANVPILNFSSLMLAPEWIRIQEKPLANWIAPAKVNAIRSEFIRQCDTLDGLADGIMNNYMACRAIFDVSQGAPNRNPWAAKRCPNNVDPNPADTTAAACLTDGQISTLKFVYSPYRFATPLANSVTTFGMWLPNTDPSGNGLILPARFIGQEGAGNEAVMHSHLGVLGVTGFLMKNTSANPLDYIEGGALNGRRIQLSDWLDATNPNLAAFAARGGKMIVAIGTDDTLASPGSQLNYYQALLDTMGRPKVDSFARLFVIPQVGHNFRGTNYANDGNGRTIPVAAVPSTWDRVSLLVDWVENGIQPGMAVTVTAGERSLPLCSYPAYPQYGSGPVNAASSYSCVEGGRR